VRRRLTGPGLTTWQPLTLRSPGRECAHKHEISLVTREANGCEFGVALFGTQTGPVVAPG